MGTVEKGLGAAAVPDVARRNAISHWLEGDKSVKLSDPEMKLARQYQQFFAETGKQGLERGVIDDLLDNYVTHVYGPEAREVLRGATGPSRSPKTPYGERRVGPDTLRELNVLMKEKNLTAGLSH